MPNPFASKFSAIELTLFRTENWSVLVRKGQSTLGSVVLVANRNFISAAELTAEEAAEFPAVVGRLEAALSRAFAFDKINYLCLMMVGRHYHFHVFPRYETAREFAGREWKDETWPATPVIGAPEQDMEMLLTLKQHLASFL